MLDTLWLKALAGSVAVSVAVLASSLMVWLLGIPLVVKIRQQLFSVRGLFCGGLCWFVLSTSDGFAPLSIHTDGLARLAQNHERKLP